MNSDWLDDDTIFKPIPEAKKYGEVTKKTKGVYYFISDCGIGEYSEDFHTEVEDDFIQNYNYFTTKEQAEKVADWELACRKLRKWCDDANADKGQEQAKDEYGNRTYYIYIETGDDYDSEQHYLNVRVNSAGYLESWLNFKNEYLAELCIKECRAELLTFFGVE